MENNCTLQQKGDTLLRNIGLLDEGPKVSQEVNKEHMSVDSYAELTVEV
jgi:hypothetical protein